MLTTTRRPIMKAIIAIMMVGTTVESKSVLFRLQSIGVSVVDPDLEHESHERLGYRRGEEQTRRSSRLGAG